MPLRRREATAGHARRRLPAKASPQRPNRNAGYQPSIHRPQNDGAHWLESQRDFCSRYEPRATVPDPGNGLTHRKQAAWNYPAHGRRADQSWHSQPLPRKRSELVRYQANGAAKGAPTRGAYQQGGAKRRTSQPCCFLDHRMCKALGGEGSRRSLSVVYCPQSQPKLGVVGGPGSLATHCTHYKQMLLVGGPRGRMLVLSSSLCILERSFNTKVAILS